MASIAITLSTLSGSSYQFSLPVEALALQGKLHVADELGRPADLQRWLVNGAIVDDGDALAGLQAADSKEALQVLCVFLPRTFDLKVKVVKFSPGLQAQSAEEVCISISPTMTVDAAKFEALSAAGAVGTAARLLKAGLRLQDDRTIEHYHIDPDSTLHLIVPRSRSDEGALRGNSTDLNGNALGEYNEDDALTMADAFHKISGKKGSKTESITSDKSGQIEKEGSKTVLSPRQKEAASMFTTMGVHRLRPRRSASTPVFKALGMQEMSAQVGKEDQASNTCDAVSSDSDHISGNTMEIPSGFRVQDCQASQCQAALPDAGPTPCIPQKPCEPRAALSRPARGRPSSRCASPMAHLMDSVVRPETSAGCARAQPLTGLARPPKVPTGQMRPPTAPRPDTAQPQSELERPATRGTGRGQRSTASTSLLLDDQPQQPSIAEPLSWVHDWAKLSAKSHTGDRCALSQPVEKRRSASCRALGIDRFAHVTCC